MFDVHAAPTHRRDAHEHTEVRGTTFQPGEHVNAAKTPQSAFQFILKVLDGSRLGTLGERSWTRFLNLGQPFPYEEYRHVGNRKEMNTNR